MPFHKLPPSARAYILANTAAAILMVGFAALHDPLHGSAIDFVLLVVFAIVANLPKVRLTVHDGKMTLSNTVIYLTILLRPSLLAALLVAMASGISATVFIRPVNADGSRGRITWYKPALTTSNHVLSAWVAAAAWRLAGGPVSVGHMTPAFLLALALMSGAYFVVNTLGISLAVAFAQELDVVRVWRDNFLWTFPGCLFAVSAAAGTTMLYGDPALGQIRWLSFLLLPPVYVVYYSYRLYLDKINTEILHVHELNDLNARVISTLAMTIEAKDRYTHKHVERVREYAMSIARELNVSGPELDAVRIGAMVHDIGKIAVPEMILTKPGKLTPEEHERMKSHVLVGVKILEAVNFPFPVTDAVAAHHEQWDGNGYPHGLKGEEIPLVGRIVAIADGFDALTSERHYRKAMSTEEALAIIEKERGHYYDPRVVDALIRGLPRVRPVIEELNRHEGGADDLSGRRRMIPQEALEEIASAAEEAVYLAEISLTPNVSYTSQEVIDLLLEKVENLRLLPVTVAAVFIADEESQEVRVRGCRGLYSQLFEGLTMKLGEGVSGWVVAHGQAALNATAASDLARRVEPGQNLELNSVLSVPLQIGGACMGAISLYHTGYNLYNAHHQRLLSTLAEHASGALDTLAQLETNHVLAYTDSLTGLPNMRSWIKQLELLTTEGMQPFSVLLLDLNDFKKINDTHGHLEGDRVLRDVARILTESTRTLDVVGRYAGDEFVIICKSPDEEDSDRIAQRIRTGLSRYRTPGPGAMSTAVSASIGSAYFPSDGSDWRGLLSAADRRMYTDKLDYHGLGVLDSDAGRTNTTREPIPKVVR